MHVLGLLSFQGKPFCKLAFMVSQACKLWIPLELFPLRCPDFFLNVTLRRKEMILMFGRWYLVREGETTNDEELVESEFLKSCFSILAFEFPLLEDFANAVLQETSFRAVDRKISILSDRYSIWEGWGGLTHVPSIQTQEERHICPLTSDSKNLVFVRLSFLT